MLFAYYTLIFANVFIIDSDSFTSNDEKGTSADNQITSYNFKILQINNTDVKPNFQLKQMNYSHNLKSNFFDKMLSNEMLSIKQQIHDKDSSYGSTVYLTFRNNAQTPTLEIKQKWLLEKPLAKQENHITLENVTCSPNGANSNTIIRSSKKGVEHEKRNLANIKSKVIDVRSFPSFYFTTIPYVPLPYLTLPFKATHATHCNCTKSDIRRTCSRHHCGKDAVSTLKICSHNNNADCTRTSEISPISVTYYPYYLYSGYYVGATPDYAYNTYYYPDIVNDFKVRKHKKHRKTKKPYYYDSYLEEGGEFLEDEADYETNTLKGRYDGKKYKIKYGDQGDTGEVTDLSKKLCKGYLEIVNRDEFVSEVMEDLKDYYSDVIIKDCYCSCFKKSRFIIFHFIFIGFCYVILCFVNSI